MAQNEKWPCPDLVDSGGPHKRSGIGIPSHHEVFDGLLQIRHAVKRSPAHRFLTQLGEPAFDQVQPTGTGGNEVQHKARMFVEPARIHCSNRLISDSDRASEGLLRAIPPC